MDEIFTEYLSAWELKSDGPPIRTRTSHLLPVRRQSLKAMLKIAHAEEERRGGRLMKWWEGDGAADVIASRGPAILLERAMGETCLDQLVQQGDDDRATRIICDVTAKLHKPRDKVLPVLVPLVAWFGALAPAAASGDAVLAKASAMADELLSVPQEAVVLHGDIHHGNIIDFGCRGWLAIDPKGLIGERGFDYANLFCNPTHQTATAPGRLMRQVQLVCALAGLERQRLLKWILALAGLSAAWSINEGIKPETALAVAAISAAELGF